MAHRQWHKDRQGVQVAGQRRPAGTDERALVCMGVGKMLLHDLEDKAGYPSRMPYNRIIAVAAASQQFCT